MDKLKMHSPNLTDENVAKIRDLFPGCVTEAADETGERRLVVDFDQLRQELSDHVVEGPQERYRLDWPGKRESLALVNAPIAKTLRPSRDESVDFDTTQNLFIEGDNLEALKLLQDNYLGKVKLIYIDPPYNTGKDFVYCDNFRSIREEYEFIAGVRDEEGGKLIANSETDGRYHSRWLQMLYPRLKLARNLLTDDGAILISIDEHEQANLKIVCDEIFGSNNFVAVISVINNMKGRNDKAHVATSHEYLMVYGRGNFQSFGFPLTDEQLSEYKYSDDKGRKYALRDLRKRGRPDRREDRPNMWFPIFFNENVGTCSLNRMSPDDVEITPLRGDKTDGRWRWGREKVAENISILHPSYSAAKDRWDVKHRVYLDGAGAHVVDGDEEDDDDDNIPRSSKPKSFLWGGEISTDVASREFKKLFPNTNPDYPKSPFLMEKLIQFGSQPNDLVVDFFGGFGTTAHAALSLGAQGKPRKFILVQWPEQIDHEHPFAQQGFATVAEIAKERIRRAGKKILEGECHPDWNRDVGFRVLKVDTSNMKDVYYRPEDLRHSDLLDMVGNVKEGRSAEDLLFQVLVDWGVDLTLPIRCETVQGKTVFFVDDNALVACFDTGVTEELVKALAGHEPLRVVFRDNGFVSDAVKINVEQIFRQLSPATDIKSI